MPKPRTFRLSIFFWIYILFYEISKVCLLFNYLYNIMNEPLYKRATLREITSI